MTRENNDMKLMITGGGTGGHVYPGVAVARELSRREGDHKTLFVGARRGVEANIVPEEGFDIETLNITGLKGKGLFAKVASIARLVQSAAQSMSIISSFKPDVVLGVGGYASGPVGIAALIKRLPLALAEQNANPGMTNRWLGKYAVKVFATWPGFEKKFPKGVGKLTGNPIRPEFFKITRKRDDERLNILLIGGSQGARSMNRAMAEAVSLLNDISGVISVTHQTGAQELNEVRKAYDEAKFPWIAEKFFHDMPQRLADADLVISRSGAGAVAEICAVGRAALYVPFPFAADDHQTRNAEAVVKACAAMLIKDSELTGEKLVSNIKTLSGNRELLQRMAANAKSMAKPNAAADIVDELLKLAGEAA